jgi:hypothetical protein
VLARCSGVLSSSKSSGRVFAIGAYHMSKIVGGLVSNDIEVINLCKPGWVLNKDTIKECSNKLQSYGFCGEDTVIIDPLSNTIFCGSDTDGNPVNAVKLDDNCWHVIGDLTIRPKSVIKKTLQNCTDIFNGTVPDNLLVLAPIPRYVTKKCCTDPDHVTNFDSPDYATEMAAELDQIDELLTGWALNITEKSGVFNIQCLADITDAPLSELTFQEAALWPANDPVHVIGPAYTALARVISAHLKADDDGTENPPKRPRLASVVVQREEAASNSRGRPAAAASWSTGMLPPVRRGGARGGYNAYDGTFWRGRGSGMRFGGGYGGYRGQCSRGGRGRGRGGFF